MTSDSMRNSSVNSSASPLHVSGIEELEITKVKNYAKDLLKSRIFLGRYLERRLADQRIGYRDIVLVSPAEVELKKDLLDVQSKLRNACADIIWIGITDGYLDEYTGPVIWTEIDNEPFGPFWFQIKSLKIRQNEIILLLKCLRHISEAFLEIEPILTRSGRTTKVNKSITNKSNSQTEKNEAAVATINDSFAEIITTLKTAVSIRNVKEFLTFLFALIIAMFTGSTAFISFVGNFVLALVRELSYFVKNSTPLMLGFLDFCSKIIGGFYILLAMFFKQSTPMIPQNRREIAYYEGRKRNTDRSFDNSFD